jgi:hypothetical protein
LLESKIRGQKSVSMALYLISVFGLLMQKSEIWLRSSSSAMAKSKLRLLNDGNVSTFILEK